MALIFVGIRAGIFTAVESAAIAVVYALLVTALRLSRRCAGASSSRPVTGAARTTGLILFVIGAAAAFGWLLAYLEVPAAAVDALHVDRRRASIAILLLIVRDAAGAGHVHGPGAADPDLHADLPAGGQGLRHRSGALRRGADPDGGIGLITPPVGSVLFVGTAIGKISVGEALRTIWPFYLAALAVLLLVVLLPQLSLWLPAALKH